jgi:4-amino-4-deoxy-L-arabinose transferase-like glycosyltransferase
VTDVTTRGSGPIRIAVLLPVVLAGLLAGRTMTRDSCTVDEFGNLPLTVAYWKPGTLHIDPGNPPLTRWIQGVGLLAASPDPGVTPSELAEIETSWDLGYRFEKAHFTDYHRLLVRARLGSVALLLATVLGVYVWARTLAGEWPALGAALLTALSPNLLAHGRLVTPDIGLACFVVWAGWATDRALRTEPGRPRILAVALAGALAGAACLSKMSGLILLPVLAGALAIGGSTGRRRIGDPLLLAGVVLFVLYAGYGFPGPGRYGALPTPLPSPYVHGILTQLREPPYPAYLLGEVRHGGWLAYYPIAFLVKIPLGALVLFALAVGATIAERRRPFGLPLALAAAFLVGLGLVTKKNIGLRYLLPALPLLHVVAAAVFRSGRPGMRGLGLAALLLAAVSGIGASRAPLAYFNGVERLWGGKRDRPCPTSGIGRSARAWRPCSSPTSGASIPRSTGFGGEPCPPTRSGDPSPSARRWRWEGRTSSG